MRKQVQRIGILPGQSSTPDCGAVSKHGESKVLSAYFSAAACWWENKYSKTCLKRKAIVPVFFFSFSQVSVLQRVVF